MAEDMNRQWTLASRPSGYPKQSDFALQETPIPAPEQGEALLQTAYLSLDPYMRGRMNAGASYTPGVDLGAVMPGSVVGRVMESRSAAFQPGDYAVASYGWSEYGTAHESALRKVDPEKIPVSTALGVLGTPGLTAYFGTFDICRPQAGGNFVVSAASGAVGAVVGQIAKMNGCRVVGTAGSAEKVAYIIEELGFDAGINYKTEDVSVRLGEECPGGIGSYFDNVGGLVTDAVLENLAYGARIAICGQISQYNVEGAQGPRNLWALLRNRARMQGFLVSDYSTRFPDGLERLAAWVQSGRLKYREDVVDGIENAPAAFIGMMRGANFGKLLVKMGGAG